MQHFAILVGCLHHISQDAVNQLGFIDWCYRNWKMASCDFRKHEVSKLHRRQYHNILKQKKCLQETGDSILQQLHAYNIEVQLNGLNVKRIIFELILLFGWQGIAYQGHDESVSSLNHGSFFTIELGNVINWILPFRVDVVQWKTFQMFWAQYFHYNIITFLKVVLNDMQT